MEELVTVALDAMGGDYAPVETVKGGVDAVNASKEIKVLMVGDEEKIRKELARNTLTIRNVLKLLVRQKLLIIMNRRSRLFVIRKIRPLFAVSVWSSRVRRMRWYLPDPQVRFLRADSLL